ncbi:MAG TPA: hypothetical protein VK750_05070 [Cytophagaceae bacterium]|jgi:hypothetical protein|nr:hypothetical protein [Cytophagaceae bacterium]
MDQIKRIKILSSLFLLLVFMTSAAYLLPMLKEKRQAFPDIALIDGLAGLDKLDFSYKGIQHELKPTKTGEEWYIDNTYPVKDQFLALIQTGLSRLKVKRILSKEFVAQADSLFNLNGIEIRWKSAEGMGSFSVVSNPNDPNSSYYRSSVLGKETYVAFVPGFTGDISNIFKLDAGEWRKKTVIAGSDRTIQSIQLNYTGKPTESFILSFINGDYQVIDVPVLDSTKLYTYLRHYEQLSVDKYLTLSKADSIKSVNKIDLIAQLDVRLLDAQASRSLDIYRLNKDSGFALVLIRPSNEWALMKTQRLFPLLVKKAYFVKK